MKTFLEHSPTGKTSYKMPDDIFERAFFALKTYRIKSIDTFVKSLSWEERQLIEITHHKLNKEDIIKGWNADFIMFE